MTRNGSARPNSCLSAALAYAAKSPPLQVLAVPPGTKKSYYSKKCDPDDRRWGATCNKHTIEHYWRQHPDANVGIATGEVSGLIVIETDTKAGHPNLAVDDGEDSLKALYAANGSAWPPDTMTIRSPTGSDHYWFAYPDIDDNFTIKGSTSKLGIGIDVLGDGNIVIAPPSVKPGVGKYERINETGAKLPPQWLTDLIKEEIVVNREPGAPEEPRIERLAFALNLLSNDDSSRWQIVDNDGVVEKEFTGWDGYNEIGMAIYRARPDDGFPLFNEFSRKHPRYKNNEAYNRHKWRCYTRCPPKHIGVGTIYAILNDEHPGELSVWNYEHPDDKPPPPTSEGCDPVDLWGKFDPPELPTGLLPKDIEKYALVEGANMGCDPAGLAMAALVACAAATPEIIKLQVKEHDEFWTEPARMWAALVGDPSTKKTPALNQAKWPIDRIDRKLVAQYLTEKEVYDQLSAADKKTRPPPKQPRIKIEDTTIEAAQEILKDSPDGVLCHQDEFSGFLGNADKYSGNKGASADRAFWMKAYNGGPSSFHRIVRGQGQIPNLSINLLGGIQPDTIRKLAADGVDDGLLQRMLFIVLRPATVDQDKPRDPVVKDYFRLVDKLHGLQPPQQQSFSENKLEDTVLRFDRGAQTIRNQLAERHIKLMNSEAVSKKLATHVGKYDGVFARLCVLWHCIENVNQATLPAIVTEDTARRVATFLHKFIFKHAVAFYIGMLGRADDHDRLGNVAGFILARKLSEITNRDIHRGDRSMRKLTDWDTLKIFEQLEALGWVERKLPKKPPAKIRWIVNPQVHTRFANRAKREAERRAEAHEAVASLFTD
jgi:hypothetical protein